jgi:hypothetical protein
MIFHQSSYHSPRCPPPNPDPVIKTQHRRMRKRPKVDESRNRTPGTRVRTAQEAAETTAPRITPRHARFGSRHSAIVPPHAHVHGGSAHPLPRSQPMRAPASFSENGNPGVQQPCFWNARQFTRTKDLQHYWTGVRVVMGRVG